MYEPHLAPKIEKWAEEFVAKRQARRRQLAPAAGPVGVPGPLHGDEDQATRRKHRTSGSDHDGPEMSQSIELENLIAKEVREWRSEVDRSQTSSRGLRQRGHGPRSGSGSLHSLVEEVRYIFVPSILRFSAHHYSFRFCLSPVRSSPSAQLRSFSRPLHLLMG